MINNRLQSMRLVLLTILIACMVLGNFTQARAHESKKILYINSYHEGYKWSDDIQSAIKALFSNAHVPIEMDTFYMDTKRIQGGVSLEYHEHISHVLEQKNEFYDYDLIITSDDAAYNFMLLHGDIFPSAVPHIFCGVPNPSDDYINGERAVGGFIEYSDYGATFDLIRTLHPEVDNIHYIVGSSLTGKIQEKNLLEAAADYNDDFVFRSLVDMSMSQLTTEVSQLGDNDVVFYLQVFYDASNHYYEYDESIDLISNASSVPVYGTHEFNLGHGLIGGKLTSGTRTGEEVAKMALGYLEEDREIQVVLENLNQYSFDHVQLSRFDIDLSLLPENSNVINQSRNGAKNVLILHSYNQGFQWTDHIDAGIKEALGQYEGKTIISTEYMDLKKANNIPYRYSFQKMFQEKYGGQSFDLVITSDDGAFDFAKSHIYPQYGNPPLVFSGVNYMSEENLRKHGVYTGVIEAYDLKGTVDAIISLQPDVKHIYVINDNTPTGRGNSLNVAEIEDYYEGKLTFEHSDYLTMPDLMNKVGSFDEDTAILLMTINKDGASNNYSYAQAIELLYSTASVPMYGVWDFYLGDGLVGGMLTDGGQQGYMAGLMGIRILNGEDPGEIDIITSSPNTYKFDMDELKRFGLDLNMLPEGAVMINRQRTFRDTYNESPMIFNVIFLLMAMTIIALIVLLVTLRRSVNMNQRIQRLATYDHLTGTLNRGSGIKSFETYLNNEQNLGISVAICFMDMNGLKDVNDRYGHGEGDAFIIRVAEAIAARVGKNDIFCRMGGDEFMVILPNVTEAQANEFGETIKSDLLNLSQKDGKPYVYSLSIGINTFVVEADTDLNEVIEWADTLMYRDKAIYRKGRR